jgi:hypothetical protein
MIHVLDSAGVPSEAKIIKIPGSSGGDTIPPGQVTGLAVTPVGANQLDLTWTANTESDLNHYDVHRSTVHDFVPSPANRIAQPTGISYSDTGLASSTTYYYRVAAVDNTGNIGQPSAEASGTTAAGGGETFYDVAFPGSSLGRIYSGENTRYGVEALGSSALVGKSLMKWTVHLRRVGSASGPITAVVRAANDAVVATFNETVDAASVPTSYASFEFTLPSPHVIQAGNRILVQYSGTNRIEISQSGTNQFDGSLTRRTRYAGSYVHATNQDVAGTMTN